MRLQTQPQHTTAFILDCLDVLLPLAAVSDRGSSSNGAGRPAQAAVAEATHGDLSSGSRGLTHGGIDGVSAASAATAMHLLLDLASSCLDRVAAPEARAAASGRAASLLQGVLAANAPPRLALKLAQAFRLAWPDVAGCQPQLGAQVRALLDDAATATPAVGLLRHFQVRCLSAASARHESACNLTVLRTLLGLPSSAQVPVLWVTAGAAGGGRHCGGPAAAGAAAPPRAGRGLGGHPGARAAGASASAGAACSAWLWSQAAASLTCCPG